MSSRIGTSLYTHGQYVCDAHFPLYPCCLRCQNGVIKGEPKNDTAHVIGARGNKSSTSTTCIIWSDETKGSESVFENREYCCLERHSNHHRHSRNCSGFGARGTRQPQRPVLGLLYNLEEDPSIVIQSFTTEPKVMDTACLGHSCVHRSSAGDLMTLLPESFMRSYEDGAALFKQESQSQS